MSAYLPSANGELIFEVSESPTFAATQVWHDITKYIHRDEGIVVDRGRASEFDDVRAGTLDLTLDVSDGLLDPRNGSSRFAGCLKVRRRCRLRLAAAGAGMLTIDGDPLLIDGEPVTVGDGTYPIFYGFTTGFPRVFSRPNTQCLMPFHASDGFRVMGNADATSGLLRIEDPVYGAIGVGRIGGTGAGGPLLTGALINGVLDDMAWPAALRDIAAGRVMVDPGTSERRSFATIKEANKAEGGDFYISRAGVATFRDRLARYSESRSVTTQATFSPSRVNRPAYTEPLEILLDDSRLVNEANYTGTSGIPQIRSDAASIAESGINDDQQSFISVNDPDAMSLAVLALTENATATDRIEQLVVNVHSQTASAVPAVLGRELFDRVALVVGSTYGAGYETMPAVVQGVRHSIGTTTWVSTFRLGPFHDYPFFTIADPVLGAIAGTGTIAP